MRLETRWNGKHWETFWLKAYVADARPMHWGCTLPTWTLPIRLSWSKRREPLNLGRALSMDRLAMAAPPVCLITTAG